MSGEEKSTACALRARCRVVLHAQSGSLGRGHCYPDILSLVLCTSWCPCTWSCLSPTSVSTQCCQSKLSKMHVWCHHPISEILCPPPPADLEIKAQCLCGLQGPTWPTLFSSQLPHSWTSSLPSLHPFTLYSTHQGFLSFPQREALPYSHLLLLGTLACLLAVGSFADTIFRGLSFCCHLITAVITLVTASICLPLLPARMDALWGHAPYPSCCLLDLQHSQSKYHHKKMVGYVWLCILKVFGKVGWKGKLAKKWNRYGWAWEAKAEWTTWDSCFYCGLLDA